MKQSDSFNLESLDKDTLLQYIQSLLWTFRLTDAFWFINVEDRYGLQIAEDLNAVVWQDVARLSAKEIVKRFGPFDDSARGFWQAYNYFLWTAIVNYNVVFTNDELVVTVSKCPPQEGRKKHGKGEYACKIMHSKEFQAFADVVTPSVKVQCIYAPPDKHPEDCYCKWRFITKHSSISISSPS